MTRTPWAAVPCLFFVIGTAGSAAAQSHPATDEQRRPIPYPIEISAPYQQALENGTRSPTGEPGPSYWQQWTDYTIQARLDPDERRIDGTVRIVYHNNSPNPLPVLFLQLIQNAHAEGALRNIPLEVSGGIELKRVMAAGDTLEEGRRPRGSYRVFGTVMQVRPPSPVSPGDSVELEIEWGFTVPQRGASGRMGWNEDNLFYIAYWYPQMAVYDDVIRWHTDQYLGRAEFYMGYGTYDLTLEAPEGWVIMAAGELQNAEEVFPAPILERIARADRSDTVVHVLTPEDFGPGTATLTSPTGYLSWHFVADSVRDVAFLAARESRWDATRTPVGDRDGDGEMDYARAQSFWRESAPKWEHAWRYTQHSVDYHSRWTQVFYPWPHMTSVEGGGIMGGGMEFPMLTLIGDYNEASDTGLYGVHTHEIAHMWVPMIVGNDERRRSWMDEGTTVFNTNQAMKEFYPGRNWDVGDREGYASFARTGQEGEIMRWSDYQYQGGAFGVASYPKPGTMLATLRGLLGEETFLEAYRTYLRNWSFKHPKPWDFFSTFNAVSGQDLWWFWRSWYFETWTLDQSVGDVVSSGDHTTVHVEDNGLVPMPARVTITLANGDVLSREVPVEWWLEGHTRAEIELQTDSPVVKVEIDAEGHFPDVDRDNNLWERT
jgi:hypothetical protein